MTATHVVVRPFPGPGGLQLPGTEVDASEWRNTSSLVQRRYLRPIDKPAQRIPTPRPIATEPPPDHVAAEQTQASPARESKDEPPKGQKKGQKKAAASRKR